MIQGGYVIVNVCLFVLLSIIQQGSHCPGKSGNLFGQGKSANFVDGQGKMMCIIRVVWLLFIFVLKKENTHLVHVIAKW